MRVYAALLSGRERSGMVFFCAVARGGDWDSGVSFAVDGASKVSASRSTSETARMDEAGDGRIMSVRLLVIHGAGTEVDLRPCAPTAATWKTLLFLRPWAHPSMPGLGDPERKGRSFSAYSTGCVEHDRFCSHHDNACDCWPRPRSLPDKACQSNLTSWLLVFTSARTKSLTKLQVRAANYTILSASLLTLLLPLSSTPKLPFDSLLFLL